MHPLFSVSNAALEIKCIFTLVETKSCSAKRHVRTAYVVIWFVLPDQTAASEVRNEIERARNANRSAGCPRTNESMVAFPVFYTQAKVSATVCNRFDCIWAASSDGADCKQLLALDPIQLDGDLSSSSDHCNFDDGDLVLPIGSSAHNKGTTRALVYTDYRRLAPTDVSRQADATNGRQRALSQPSVAHL